MSKNKHGGKRIPGPGKKLGRPSLLVERASVTLDRYTKKRLKELGSGNLSAGIREAVKIIDSSS